MSQTPLEQFTLQLCRWTEDIIDHGRCPFRKAEPFPKLMTDLGLRHPPLVFWINRDSWMAGGLLMIQQEDTPESLQDGRACADALGLKHFALWDKGQIRLWECREEGLTLHKSLPLHNANASVEGFRTALVRLLDELKVLSVTGMISPSNISPFYLANLFRAGLEGTLDSLVRAYRIARSEQADFQACPETLAQTRALHSLIRLLTLVCHDLLPATAQPEGLERAMLFALDELPDTFESLQPAPEDIPLPAPAAVGLHHLFRRINQLGLRQSGDKTAQALEILLEHEHPSPWPAEAIPSSETGAEPALYVNCAPPRQLAPASTEVAAAPVLATRALIRHLRGLTAVQTQKRSVFQLQSRGAWSRIFARLYDAGVPDAAERKMLATQLRTSWPARRLSFPPQAPHWIWELRHLAGLAPAGARFDILLPADWLAVSWGEKVLELLHESFTVELAELTSVQNLRLQLVKTPPAPEALTLFRNGLLQRQLRWEQLKDQPLGYWRLALHLPDELLTSVEQGLLCFADPDHWPQDLQREIYLYTRSNLGRRLWEITSADQPLPRISSLRTDLLRLGLPIPNAQILSQLSSIHWERGKTIPQALIDEALALWTGTACHPGSPPRPGKKREKVSPGRPAPSLETLARDIGTQVFVDGIPKFPEHYLYRYYRPALRRYHFSGPLQLQGEFFGTFTLAQADGQTLEIEGEETARALILASCGCDSTVELPQDRNLTLEILRLYREDLLRLRQNLVRHTGAALEEARQAESLSRRIWTEHGLPPLELLEEWEP